VSASDTIPLANGVGSAKFKFVNPTTEVDKSVKVTDSYSGGPQNQSVSVGDVSSAPKTYTCNRTIGPYSTCGDQSVKNLCNAKVVKTVSGVAPSGSQAFTFQLHQGASGPRRLGNLRPHRGPDSAIGHDDRGFRIHVVVVVGDA
jgi:hypothetical protein